MNGNSYEDCKKIAEEINTKLKPFITEHGSMPWKQLSEEVNHDELVYKLVLKYLRRDGFDIGNMDNPQITLSSN
jgi:hydroxymethylpyrimidine pyrophosphatase-like HAD family hydrolase|tara:strand:+ start:402 stop:623 length:222 start_codon:yes stop_codon:yes gene_type:complete